jgi:predicted transposase YbfD/YdcC
MARRTLLDYFAGLPDPRIDRTKKHRLDEILMITLTATLCGASSFEHIAEFGEAYEDWFRRHLHLKLDNGIPSHDTIYRVLCQLDHKRFAECFGRWVADWSETLGIKQVAIDGKSLRGARSNTFSGCVHLVSAWATEAGLLLGQEAVADKSSEATAIPALLDALHLKGALVTIDAAGCSPAICRQIREKKGDYLLAVKDNQPTLHEAVKQVFAEACDTDFANVEYSQHETREDGHGRHEERYVTVIENPKGLPDKWPDVAAVVQVNREREVNGKNTSTSHYYLTSLKAKAKTLGQLVRRHWAIENELHWVLDVTFGEDAYRTADKNAAANLGLVRRTAVTLLKQNPYKGSNKIKAYRASLRPEYLLELLQGSTVI